MCVCACVWLQVWGVMCECTCVCVCVSSMVCVFVLSSNRDDLLRFQDLFKFKKQREEEDVPGAKLLVHVT